MTDDSLRLNKTLALRLGISRREADELIDAGKVSVNGTVATLGARISASDELIVNGKEIGATPDYRYILFNKPVGYVCSRKAQGDNPTIYDILPADFKTLKPVGRLDKDSSGLLLLTNDGDFAHTMTHPSFKKVKIYQVELVQPLAPLHQQMISDYGIDIGDGVSKLTLQKEDDNRVRWTVTMTEGRNRQIRRTFAALGYEVSSLHRRQFGPFSLGGLDVGAYQVVAS